MVIAELSSGGCTFLLVRYTVKSQVFDANIEKEEWSY